MSIMVLIQVFDCILKNMFLNIILVFMRLNLDSTMYILEPSKAMWVKVVIDFGKLLLLVACHSARLEGFD